MTKHENLLNNRQPVIPSVEQIPYDEIAVHQWITKKESTDARGKTSIIHVVENDPDMVDEYQNQTKALLSSYVFDKSDSQHYVFNKKHQTWQSISSQKNAAATLLTEIRTNPPAGYNPNNGEPEISNYMVEYVTEHPELQGAFGGECQMPFAGHMFFRDGRIYLNSWRDQSLVVDLTVPLTPDEESIVTSMLNIIRINLANLRGEKTFQELADIINDSSNHTEFQFRYIVQNMAVCYMRPGYNIRTNLALCGQPGGVGKNYCASLMETMLGRNLCHHTKEFTSQHNGWIYGKTFVLLDEIENADKNPLFNTFVKRNTVESTVTVREMRKDEVTVQNHITYWLFSNSLFPYKTDATDRRTIFIRTLHDSDSDFEQSRIAVMRNFAEKHSISDVARAIAKFFHMINLDIAVVDTYRKTDLSRYIQDQSKNSLEKFFMLSDLSCCIKQELGRSRWMLSRDWKSYYLKFCESHELKQIPNATSELVVFSWRYKSGKNFYVDIEVLEKYRNGWPYDTEVQL